MSGSPTRLLAEQELEEARHALRIYLDAHESFPFRVIMRHLLRRLENDEHAVTAAEQDLIRLAARGTPKH